MAEAPVVKPGDKIMISQRHAVVTTVRGSGEAEVVWLSDLNPPTNEEAVWQDGRWQFKSSSLTGGYADNNPRLEPFVRQLQQPRR